MDPKTLQHQMFFSSKALEFNLKGLVTQDLTKAPVEGGNCLAWMLGHILASRNAMLEVMRKESYWPKELSERFARGSEAVTASEEALPSAERFREDLDASYQKIVEALGDVRNERLAEPAPFSPLKIEGETVGGLLASLVFHESYHVGQTGVMRRILGKETIT